MVVANKKRSERNERSNTQTDEGKKLLNKTPGLPPPLVDATIISAASRTASSTSKVPLKMIRKDKSTVPWSSIAVGDRKRPQSGETAKTNEAHASKKFKSTIFEVETGVDTKINERIRPAEEVSTEEAVRIAGIKESKLLLMQCQHQIRRRLYLVDTLGSQIFG